MAKNKRKKRPSQGADPSRIQRLLERGEAREALKEAKRQFRSEASSDNRRLLETAYLGRVKQLYQAKNLDDAKVVLAELLKLKPVVPEVLAEIPRIQVIVGDPTANSQELLDQDPSLLVEMIDHAVLDTRAVLPKQGSVESETLAVREALVLIEQGQDDAAMDRLREIPRTSPLADWRLFARGLSAFYQEDRSLADQNWDRLDRCRAAYRIAAKLREAADTPTGDEALSPGARKLHEYANRNSPAGLLREIAQAWQNEQMPLFMRLLRKLDGEFGRAQPELIHRIVDFLWKTALRRDDFRLFNDVIQLPYPPPLDPHWNRAKALWHEEGLKASGPFSIQSAWEDYLQDLDGIAAISEPQRDLARGMVHVRLAGILQAAADMLEESPPLHIEEEGEEDSFKDELRSDAARHFRKGIEFIPDAPGPYYELARLHVAQGESDRAVRVYEKLLQRQPENFDALCWLVNRHTLDEQFDQAQKYLEQAAAVRPRDPSLVNLRWNMNFPRIISLGIKRKFKQAHAVLDGAIQSAPESVPRYRLSVIRAALYLKAKDRAAAQDAIDDALAKVEQPVVVWLNLSSVATRMRVAREAKKEFEDNFKKEIKSKPTTAAAGEMAYFLHQLRHNGVKYTGQATHEKLLAKHLQGRKAEQVPWADEDLRAVSRFLRAVLPEDQYPVRLWLKGRKLFPETPHYAYWLGATAGDHPKLRRYRLPWYIDQLENALELHEEGPIKLDPDEESDAHELLSILPDEMYGGFGMPFSGPRFFDFPEEDEEDEAIGEDMFENLPESPIQAFIELMKRMGKELPNRSSPEYEEILGMLEFTMPASIQDKFRAIAQATGKTVRQVLDEMLQGELQDAESQLK